VHPANGSTPREAHGPRSYVAVWAALVGLTGALVLVNRLAPGNTGVLAAIVITPLKASLVLWAFMHLKEEGRAVRATLLAAVVLLFVFVGLLMLDYGFR
jgi:cytochrome c oxidase subunit 4